MSRHTLQLLTIALILTSGLTAIDAGAAPSHTKAEAAAKTDTKEDPNKPGHPDGVKPEAEQPKADMKPAGEQPAAAAQTGQPQNNAAAIAAGQTGSEAGAEANAEASSTEAKKPEKIVWPFDGMQGKVDKQAAQRGFQVYSQVCSACHSLDMVTYRSLEKLGFSEAEVKAIASQKQVEDENDSGERYMRPAKPFDHLVAPYANEKASRAANNGAYPPDLSLIVKAREEGPDYVHSLLTGFSNPPANVTPVSGKYYDPYFQGHWISMPPPLQEGSVSYQDDTKATVDQMARDVVVFLQWAAEPEMEDRHEMGIKVLIFLALFTGVMYAAKKRIWAKIKH